MRDGPALVENRAGVAIGFIFSPKKFLTYFPVVMDASCLGSDASKRIAVVNFRTSLVNISDPLFGSGTLLGSDSLGDGGLCLALWGGLARPPGPQEHADARDPRLVPSSLGQRWL